MAQNLTRRKAVYYARVGVPKKLQELRNQMGVKSSPEVWKSLRTRDPAVAKRALPRALEAVYRSFEEEEARLRGAGAKDRSDLVVPEEHDFERAAWQLIQDENRLDEESRSARPSTAEIERRVEQALSKLASNPPKNELDAWLRPGGALEVLGLKNGPQWDGERREVLATELREHLAENNFVLVEWAMETLSKQNHWLIEKDSQLYKVLGRRLMRAWIQALETSFKRDRGVYQEGSVTQMPGSDPQLTAPQVGGKPKKGESLNDYLDAYLKEQKQRVKANTRKDIRATIRQFIECNGDRVVTSYTRADMSQFKMLLGKVPARVEKLYPGLSIRKAIDRNRIDGHPMLKSNSIRNKLSTLAAFGNWLESNVNGVDAQNFRTTLPPKNDAGRMEPFSPEEIRKILNAHAFTGCQSERMQAQSGAYKIRDWRFWVTLIAAFTGARLNEITQLKVEDLQHADGIWTFRISDEAPGSSLKTASSRRVIPVHPRLIDLGLLAFRDLAIAAGSADLFHQIPLDKDNRRSHHAGKWFRRFLTRIGVKGQGDLGGAHRWRHTLTDALRSAGVDDYQIAQVLGHKIDAAKMTAHYGRELTMTTKQRHELLARVNYPSVDFSALADDKGPTTKGRDKARP